MENGGGRRDGRGRRMQIASIFSPSLCHERSSVGTKCTKATSSRSDGKLKSIAENRSGSQANLQQGEDHRCPRSKMEVLSL